MSELEEAELHIGGIRVRNDGTARRVQRRQAQTSRVNVAPRFSDHDMYVDNSCTRRHADALPSTGGLVPYDSDCSIDSAMQDYLDNISQDGLCVLNPVNRRINADGHAFCFNSNIRVHACEPDSNLVLLPWGRCRPRRSMLEDRRYAVILMQSVSQL